MNSKSPCKNICHLDLQRSYCVACLRTVEEISNWATLTLEEKKKINIDILDRKK